MGFWNRAKTKSSSLPLFHSFTRLFGLSLKESTPRSVEELNRSWVFASVRAISEEMGRIRLTLWNTGGAKPVQIQKHAALDLLDRVNPYMTKYTLFERLQGNLELFGNEYWYLEAQGKTPNEIYPLSPTTCKPVPDAKDYISYYTYTLGAVKYKIPRTGIIHFKTYNPTSDLLGMSTLSAARLPAETDAAASEYNKAFFENSAMPGVILKMPGELTPEQTERLREEWNQEFQGFKRNYRTAIASGGLDIEKLELSHADMEFLEQRKFSRDEILAIFRVPKTILGMTEEVNRATAESAMYVFMQWTILPKMRKVVDTLNEFYLPLFGDNLEFHLENTPPTDRAQLFAEYTAGIQGGFYSINDVRRKEGLPLIEGGESVLVPFSMTPYGEPIPTRGERSLKSMDLFEKQGAHKIRSLEPLRNRFETQYKETATKLLKGQRDRALIALKKRFKAVKAGQDLLDELNEVSVTIDLFTPLTTELVKEYGKRAMQFVGGEDFEVTPDLISFVSRHTKKFAGQITQTTQQGIRTELARGLADGEGLSELTDRIIQYAGFNPSRAELIARTEVAEASKEAELEAWTQSEVVEQKRWYTAEDERVHEGCADLHGVTVELDEDFDYEDGPIEGPPGHPSCRCVLLPIVKSS
ncbi:MAG: portal protein [Siphoviridae sp. ctvD11]|nr:MAG: portal protein [Siphoviridae sp. ctvD11]